MNQMLVPAFVRRVIMLFSFLSLACVSLFSFALDWIVSVALSTFKLQWNIQSDTERMSRK